MAYNTIRFESSDGVARLTINRPEQFNGMTNEMVRETHEALTAASLDRSIRVLVLTGSGDRAFCPGADLNWASNPNRGADPAQAIEPRHFQVPVLLHQMPAVTIAAINGACAGAGLGWACGCDIRIAKRSAVLNTAFLNVAVAGDMGLPWSLPRLVGASRARELSFFPGKVSADEAYRMGLVTRLAEDDAFHSEVDALVESLMSRAPHALSRLKAHYVAAEGMGFSDYVALETERHLRQPDASAAADTQEAFRAFVEKRKPVFGKRD
jgi:2-(1,2-epoxy-1,2-dihydrophenyl)acetyl-CoA isomerase